jgi:hypothetical protein
MFSDIMSAHGVSISQVQTQWENFGMCVCLCVSVCVCVYVCVYVCVCLCVSVCLCVTCVLSCFVRLHAYAVCAGNTRIKVIGPGSTVVGVRLTTNGGSHDCDVSDMYSVRVCSAGVFF